ncbi:MAG TPA: ABC transporter ATP-binding protein [Chloroflexota bacterium]|nr:ABC transporter ATP-binding protein [Chloroflexota bacterium]
MTLQDRHSLPLPALDVRDVHSGYGEVQILWGVSLKLDEGKVTTLVGGNGSGKTTLLRTIMGLVPTWRGSVSFRGTDVTRLPAHDKADRGLTLVPEGRQLFTDLTVLENLELGATPRHARAESRRTLEWVFDLFPRLRERSGQLAGTLSGGEQQMVAIARGLMGRPKVLMFDEPSLGLSPLFVLNLFEIIRRLKAEGLTMLLVEQNVQMALAVSDYAYVLSGGKVAVEGPAARVRQMEDVRRAYLGL